MHLKSEPYTLLLLICNYQRFLPSLHKCLACTLNVLKVFVRLVYELQCYHLSNAQKIADSFKAHKRFREGKSCLFIFVRIPELFGNCWTFFPNCSILRDGFFEEVRGKHLKFSGFSHILRLKQLFPRKKLGFFLMLLRFEMLKRLANQSECRLFPLKFNDN